MRLASRIESANENKSKGITISIYNTFLICRHNRFFTRVTAMIISQLNRDYALELRNE